MPGASVYLGHEALSPSSHTSSQFSYFWTFPVDFRINERATSTSVFWKILIRKLYNECMSEALRITELFTSTFVFWSDSWRSPYKRTVPVSFPFCKQIPPLFLYMQFPRRNHVRPQKYSESTLSVDSKKFPNLHRQVLLFLQVQRLHHKFRTTRVVRNRHGSQYPQYLRCMPVLLCYQSLFTHPSICTLVFVCTCWALAFTPLA